eukprot:8335818-Ditylum_brightwellii.AAC.1
MDKRREFNRSKVTRKIDDQVTDRNWEDLLIVDTGGERYSTITKRAWHVFENTNQEQLIKGYGSSDDGRICLIVNATKKATFPGRDEPVILILNHATLIDDENESELLL